MVDLEHMQYLESCCRKQMVTCAGDAYPASSNSLEIHPQLQEMHANGCIRSESVLRNCKRALATKFSLRCDRLNT